MADPLFSYNFAYKRFKPEYDTTKSPPEFTGRIYSDEPSAKGICWPLPLGTDGAWVVYDGRCGWPVKVFGPGFQAIYQLKLVLQGDTTDLIGWVQADHIILWKNDNAKPPAPAYMATDKMRICKLRSAGSFGLG